MKVLIAGGAGFIGSTIASACLDDGITPVILDNLSTGRAEFTRGRIFFEGDIADGALIDEIFRAHPDIEAVLHCAAMIVVPESVREPLRYYRENVAKSLDLIQSVRRNGCNRYLFSSSAAIYQPGDGFTVDEESSLAPSNPYARTKVAMEWLLEDCARATDLRAVSLRYFNPVGADPRMRTGPQAVKPTHVLAKLIEAALAGGEFTITGTDWPTRDGTGIRDYIHVWDLARAHVRAIRRFDDIVGADRPYEVINLGTGSGTTVRELLSAFEQVLGRPLPVRTAPPRPGDSVGCFTRADKAWKLLEWRAELSLPLAIQHSLEWAGRRDTVLNGGFPAGA